MEEVQLKATVATEKFDDVALNLTETPELETKNVTKAEISLSAIETQIITRKEIY